MRSYWLRTDENGKSELAFLPLHFVQMMSDLAANDKGFEHVRMLRRGAGVTGAGPGAVRKLGIVVSGLIQVASNDTEAIVGPGDVLFVDDHRSMGHTLTYQGEARLLQIDVADDWTPPEIVQPLPYRSEPTLGEESQILELAMRSRMPSFADFGQIFDGTPQQAAPRPTLGGTFLELRPGIIERWRSAGTFGLFAVLSGRLRVAVAGAESAVLSSGGLCLIQDAAMEIFFSADEPTRIVALSLPSSSSWLL
jgi:hypothetical protein